VKASEYCRLDEASQGEKDLQLLRSSLHAELYFESFENAEAEVSIPSGAERLGSRVRTLGRKGRDDLAKAMTAFAPVREEENRVTDSFPDFHHWLLCAYSVGK
jgi:hypothetical protein